MVIKRCCLVGACLGIFPDRVLPAAAGGWTSECLLLETRGIVLSGREDGVHHEGPAAAPEVLEGPASESQVSDLGIQWPLLVWRLEKEHLSEKKIQFLLSADEKHLCTKYVQDQLTGAADTMIINPDSRVGRIIFTQNEPAWVSQCRWKLWLMLTRSCKCGETLSDAALTYALVTDKNNQWENRHDSDKKADKNNLIVWSQWQENRRETAKGPANLPNLLFSNAPMLSCLQKGKNNIMRTQDLWFSCYMRVWWMCQCLLLVKTENPKKKVYAGKCLDMNINISSTAGKHLNLWRDQQRIAQKCNSHGEDRRTWKFWISSMTQCKTDICHIFRSGSTSGNRLSIFRYCEYLPETPVLDDPILSLFSFTVSSLLFRSGNFLTSAVIFWYCSTLLT